MIDTIGKFTVRASAFGDPIASKWRGHWTIYGPDQFGGRDSVADGDVEGPFASDVEAIEAGRLVGVERAKEMQLAHDL